MKTVTMPNGLEVADVPEGTTQSVLIDRLLSGNHITTQQAQEWGKGLPEGSLGTDKTVGDDTPISDSLNKLPQSLRDGAPRGATVEGANAGMDAIASNMDIPGGMAGAMAGASAGAVGGPIGSAIGGVVGGAVGTFGGSLMSDYLTSDDMDMGDATKEALISAGFDIATLGTLKGFKATAKAMGFGPDEIASLWQKFSSGDGVGEPQALSVGSPESLQQTQNFLQNNEGSLTAYQTGKASGVTTLMEGVGEIGVLSGRYYEDLNSKNAKAISDELNRLIDSSMGEVSPGNIGESVLGILQGGRTAASRLYDEGLGEVTARIGQRPVQPKWVVGTVKKFLKDNKKEWGYDLDPTTLKLAREWETALEDISTMSVKDLLAFQKRLNTQVTQLGDFGQTQNSVASRELAQLSSRIRQTTAKLLENVDPASAKVYGDLNTAYGEAMGGLLPKLNASVVARADKGDYESIARVLEGKNPDQIEAFMKSIDTAYTQAEIAGVDMAKEARFATSQDARKAIQTGWLQNIFGESVEEGFNPKTFARLADHYEKPANARAARAILGEDFPTFKMLLNVMNEATKKQSGFVGSLVLRSKEAAGVSTVAQSAVGGAAAAASLPAAGAVFFGPVLLANIASNKGAVQALLKGNRKASVAAAAGKVAAVSEIMNQTLEQIMGMMTEEEQASVRNSMRGG